MSRLESVNQRKGAATPPSGRIASRARKLAYSPPPSRAETSTESTQQDRGTKRSNRPQEPDNAPQRTVPRRGDPPIGRPAHEEWLATPKRQAAAELHGSTRQWEDRGSRWQDQSSGRRESREYQDRSRSSRQWQEDQRWTEQSRHGQSRQDWSSQQGWRARSFCGDGEPQPP